MPPTSRTQSSSSQAQPSSSDNVWLRSPGVCPLSPVLESASSPSSRCLFIPLPSASPPSAGHLNLSYIPWVPRGPQAAGPASSLPLENPSFPPPAETPSVVGASVIVHPASAQADPAPLSAELSAPLHAGQASTQASFPQNSLPPTVRGEGL